MGVHTLLSHLIFPVLLRLFFFSTAHHSELRWLSNRWCIAFLEEKGKYVY